MNIDIDKPVEIYNPKTGEVRDVPTLKWFGGVTAGYFDTYPFCINGWRNYKKDGTPIGATNNWHLRNKVQDLDLTQPLYVDGERVYLVNSGFNRSSEENVIFWQNLWTREGSYTQYINVTRHPDGSGKGDNSTFVRKTMKNQSESCAIKGTISNNPGVNTMLDLNKPLTVNGKDAKVIHTFDNGNLAVIVDGETDVMTFRNDGEPTGRTNYAKVLKNKVVETTRYINVYPGDTYTTRGTTYNYETQQSVSKTYANDGFCVKQTLIDGKVVKNEIVS